MLQDSCQSLAHLPFNSDTVGNGYRSRAIISRTPPPLSLGRFACFVFGVQVMARGRSTETNENTTSHQTINIYFSLTIAEIVS